MCVHLTLSEGAIRRVIQQAIQYAKFPEHSWKPSISSRMFKGGPDGVAHSDTAQPGQNADNCSSDKLSKFVLFCTVTGRAYVAIP